MSFLAGLVGLLGLLFLLIAILGVIAPAIFKNKKTGEVPGRFQLLVGGGVLAVVAFIISGTLAPSPEASTIQSASSQPTGAKVDTTTATKQQQQPKPAVEKSLGMEPEEFRQAFNKIIAPVNQDYKMAELDIERGEVNDAFKRMLGPNVGMIGTVNKSDGALRELLITVGGGGKEGDVLKPIVVLLSASQALNPQVPKQENSKVVMAMLKQAMANIETGESVEQTVGQLQYTVSASKMTGVMFAISSL